MANMACVCNQVFRVKSPSSQVNVDARAAEYEVGSQSLEQGHGVVGGEP